MANPPKCTLSLRYKLKPGCKEALLKEIKTVLDSCFKEPEFVVAILQQSKDSPDELMLFEVWKGTYEDFVRVQGPKPYRKAYLTNSKKLVESVEVKWGIHFLEWGPKLS